MGEWNFAQWLRFALIWLGIFAVIGGIISQGSGGASGRGFFEGMWKGVEIFFLVVLIIGVLGACFWGMTAISSSLNSSI